MGKIIEAEIALRAAVKYLIKKKCKKIILGCTELPIAIFAYKSFKKAKKKFMPKDTVEGEQLAREIAPYVLRKINKKKIPLMCNLLKTILKNKKLKINW